jgi:hypothetical protein
LTVPLLVVASSLLRVVTFLVMASSYLVPVFNPPDVGELRSQTAGPISLPSFGKFKVKHSPAGQGRNRRAGETIAIAALRKLGFSPAKQVKDALAA